MTTAQQTTCGTWQHYCRTDCNCAACRKAWREHVAALRRIRAAKPIPDHVHGTVNGYTNYQCRCPSCRKAMQAGNRVNYQAARHQRRMRSRNTP